LTSYLRTVESTLEPDDDLSPLINDAFELRAAGKTIAAVRDHLAGWPSGTRPNTAGTIRSQHG
jgi:hypothetical protein